MTSPLRRLKESIAHRAPWLAEAVFWATWATRAAVRAETADERAALRGLRAEVGDQFRRLPGGGRGAPALLFAFSRVEFARAERMLATAFERAGHAAVMLAPRFWFGRRAYRRLGLDRVASPTAFEREVAPDRVERALAGATSTQDLLDLAENDIRVGKYAAATACRQLRLGALDLTEPAVRATVAACLGRSFAAADAARRILDHYRPGAVSIVDRGYTPFGEMFDACVARGIPVISFNFAHRSDRIILKRYGAENRSRHFAALSDATWARLKTMPWDDRLWARVEQDFRDGYTKGEWFAEVGTQFDVATLDRQAMIERLGLDPAKKTAVVFAHIFWDATFFWGEDLFRDYEAWLCAVLKVAAKNDRLNWIVKVHPANVVKNVRDGIADEHNEVAAIRHTLGELPAHMRLLAADTDISTLSVFPIADYCLTVRGTVGMEASCRGIRVLTAGTGRYDRLGFTLDFDDRDAYLACLDRLEDVPPMSRAETELARRYAYGAFIVRAVRPTSVEIGFKRDATATLQTRFLCADGDALATAPDVNALAEWLRSGDEDFCVWPDDAAAVAESAA